MSAPALTRPGRVVDRVARLLEPNEAILVVLAITSLGSAIAFAAVTWSFIWAGDLERNLDAARAIVDGHFGTTEGYLYSPLAALLTVPLLALPFGAAAIVWLTVKAAIVLAGVAQATGRASTATRAMIAIAALAFLPVVHDLALGNVSIVLLGVVALVAWQPDRLATGVPLGVLLATVPKPVLIPILVWMVVRRRRALAVAVVTAVGATFASLVIVGPGPDQTWRPAHPHPPNHPSGNLALSAWPAPVAVALSVVVVAATVVAIVRGEAPGFVASLACGLLVSSYTVLYGGAIVLAAVPALVRAAPRATIGLALVAPILLIGAFQVWVAAFVVLALAIPTERWPRSVAGLSGETSATS
jgi:hypothetical protein